MKRSGQNLKKYKKVCKEIWGERPHKCEHCGCGIGSWDMDLGENVPKYHNFQHTKGRQTEAQCLKKEDIELICFACHSKADHGRNEKGGAWLK